MLHLKFAQLPKHERRLYQHLAAALVAGFALGLLWVLLGFSDQRPPVEAEWQESVVPAADDVAALFAVVTQQPRWFTTVASQPQPQPQQDLLKALEGKPESLRLTGLVSKGATKYALFLPLVASAGTAAPVIRQLAVGDTLVGDWVVVAIGANQVQIRQGDEVQVITMYQPPKP